MASADMALSEVGAFGVVASFEQLSLYRPKLSASGLLDLPTELRLVIGEYVFRKNPAVLNVDLRRPERSEIQSSNTYAFILTCQQIYKECANIRYEVNKVNIYAPVLTPEPLSVSNRKYTRNIAGRLVKLAIHQTGVRQLRRTTILLGQLPNLQVLRWVDFMASWLLVKDAIISLKDHIHGLVLAFAVYLSGGVTGQIEMCADSPESILAGPECYYLRDRSKAELTDGDAEKLRKVKTTIAKTLFPRWASKK